MTIKELKALVKSNFVATPGINFADAQSATINALTEFYGLEDLSPREIKANKTYIMALIEEVIDEILPEKLADRVGDFAEIKQYARDAEVVFHVKGVGKRRAYLSIKKGARGGLYQAARLDDFQLTLPTWTETVGVFVTLEEILLGRYSLVELMNNILDGFTERLYVQVVEALQAAVVPAANRGSAAGIDNETLDDIIRVVSAYGRPMIMGFHEVVQKLNNVPGFLPANAFPNVPVQDLDEIRGRGYVGIYKGAPIVLLPNYVVNEFTNADWLLNEGMLFILPAGERPVKVAMKGELHLQEVLHPTGSAEWNAHKILGVGLLLQNNIGLYVDTDAREKYAPAAGLPSWVE
jgi:hypothetical protein